MSLLEVEDLRAGYGQGEVLHGISLTVDEGETVVVLGANGAGKTTTMRAVAGLMPRRGAVRFNGKVLTHASSDKVVDAGISLVPQGRGTFDKLTVRENLEVGAARRRDAAAVKADIERWCALFPVLAERSKQTAGTLSGGEQQMLAIARALMSRPRLLLCDEPSLGLAPLIVRDVFAALHDISQQDGTAMLIVEQNAQIALAQASRAYLLEVGSIVGSDSAEAMRSSDNVRRAYLGY